MKFKKFKIFNPTKIFFGKKEIKKIGLLSKKYGKHALVVTGKYSNKKNKNLKLLLSYLEKEDINHTVFDKVVPNPPFLVIDKGAKFAREKNCDLVIALGGGSSIDTAKGIAISAISGKLIWSHLEGKYKIEDALPIIAIPTTAGTGSEVTRYAVMTNLETKEKRDIDSELIYPKIAIIDSSLTLSLPPKLTAATGIDALSQAIEAYFQVNANFYTDLLAEETIKLVIKNLPLAYKNGENIEAREAMSLAATLSGLAIDGAGVILTHALEHPLSGHLNITHGKGLAALMPAVLDYVCSSRIEKSARLVKLLGLEIKSLNVREIASLLSQSFKSFLKKVNLEIDLDNLGVNKSMIDIFVKDAFKTMGGCIKRTPRVPSRKKVAELYKKSFRDY